MISAGGRHTCFLTTEGTVKCWGNNYHGELGNGSNIEKSTSPVNVSGLNRNVTALTTGGFHNCAIVLKKVECWGENESGQLGDGTTLNQNHPVKVIGLPDDVIAVTAGESFTCALSHAGLVSCWGENRAGQLGNGTTKNSSYPISVNGLESDTISIVAGNNYACALMRSGNVKCWGHDIQNPLGDPVLSPQVVHGLSGDISTIAAGGLTTCALTESGVVNCWGEFSAENTNNRPQEIKGLPRNITTIVAGDVHFCVLTKAGRVVCWGNNQVGQLGNGTAVSSNDTPINVLGLDRGVIGISASGAHTCALMSSYHVKCWGWNGAGQLGDGTIMDRNAPVDVVGLDFP